MPPYRTSVPLDQPPETVFPQLVDLGRSLDADHEVDHVERVDADDPRTGDAPPHEGRGEGRDEGAPAVGTRWRATNRVDGRPEAVDIELVALDPPSRIELDVRSNDLHTRERIELVADGHGGCEVISTVTFPDDPQEGTDSEPVTDEPADRPAFVGLGATAARGLGAPSPDPR